MTASLQVLRNGHVQPFTQRELLRAKRTLLTRHESDLKVSAVRAAPMPCCVAVLLCLLQLTCYCPAVFVPCVRLAVRSDIWSDRTGRGGGTWTDSH